MPVARIVSRHVAPSSALHELSERLRAAGYQVEQVTPDAAAGDADLVIELSELPARDAVETALRLALEGSSDLFIAPGLVDAEAEIHPPESRQADAPQPAGPIVESGGRLGETVEQLGAALADGGAGIRDAMSGMRARVTGSWSRFQQRRLEGVRALRLERERRENEREERRRQHELELRRQAEEKQRMISERERLAAERERVLREQMARDAALRAERERVEREAMAREAARRAEAAYAAEEERRRAAAVQAERQRVLREQEERYAAALRIQRLQQQRQAEAEVLRQQQAWPEPAVTPVEAKVAAAQRVAPVPVFDTAFADAAPVLKPRPRRPRRTPSPRERQWQRAALLASIATVAAMIGFAIAANVHPSSPLPAALIENTVQQQVPFGPARMDVSSAGKAPAPPSPSPVQPVPRSAKPGKPVPSSMSASPKPSAAKSNQSRARRSSRDRDVTAEDEVIVHRAPGSRVQPVQTTAGVRRYSDED